MRERSTTEGRVDLNQGGSPHGQMGEYTCKGKVDLAEGTVSEWKLGHDNNNNHHHHYHHHHHHICLHLPPFPPPPSNNDLNSKKMS